MRRKGCFVVFVILLALVAVFVAAVKHIQSRFNPVYQGKSLRDWADEAIGADDHAIRQRAVEVLREACDREGEDARLHLYYHLVNARGGIERSEVLPAELVPFLLEAFKKEGQCAGMVAASLGRCPASETVPGLVELLREEREPYKRDQLIKTLGRFGPKAREAIPLIQESRQDRDKGVCGTSREALEKIVPEKR